MNTGTLSPAHNLAGGDPLQQLHQQQRELAGALETLRASLRAEAFTTPSTESPAELRTELILLRSEVKMLRELSDLMRASLEEFRQDRRQTDRLLWHSLNAAATPPTPGSPMPEPRPHTMAAAPVAAAASAAALKQMEGDLANLRAHVFELVTDLGKIKRHLGLVEPAPELAEEEPLPERVVTSTVSAVPAKNQRRRWGVLAAALAILALGATSTVVAWQVWEKRRPAPVLATTASLNLPYPGPLSEPARSGASSENSLTRRLAKAKTLARNGETAALLTECRQLVAEHPTAVEPRFLLAHALAGQGQIEAALAEYRQVLRQAPTHVLALNNLAYHLATHPSENIRNGAEALRLAQRACAATKEQDPSALDTLAAAYAELGQFTDARLTGSRALMLATQQKRSSVAREIRQRLQWYDQNLPYRDAAEQPVPSAAASSAPGNLLSLGASTH